MTEREMLKEIKKQSALLEAIKEDQRITAEEMDRVALLPISTKQHELLQRLNRYHKQSLDAGIKLVALKERGKEIINRLADKEEQAVLYWRYIDGKNWEEIAKAIPCSWATVFRIERRAFRNLKNTR